MGRSFRELQQSRGSNPLAGITDDTPGEVNWFTAMASSKHASRIQSAFVSGMAMWQAGQRVHGWYMKRQRADNYRVSVLDSDEAFPHIQLWLINQLPKDDRRSLRVTTRRVRDDLDANLAYEENEDGFAAIIRGDRYYAGRSRRRAFMAYDGEKPQTIYLEGHRVQVTVEEASLSGGSGVDLNSKSFRPGMLVFSTTTPEAQNAVLRQLDKVAEALDELEATRFRVNIATKFDGWQQLSSRVPRPLETVVLEKGLRDELVEDLSTFLNQESRYAKLGIPWHRGYLFHGPPGTGKTSLPQALASHFDLEVNYVPLGDVKSDTALANLLSDVDDREILLLEDIDTVRAARTRDSDDEVEKVTLNGLLQALDGVTTPHGLIVFMTTNHRDRLEPALVRSGRVDVERYFGFADQHQVEEIIRVVTGEVVVMPDLTHDHGVTPADVVGVIKANLHRDDEEVIARVRAMLDERIRANARS